MDHIRVLLTFDYELPLGRADDYDRALFAPAEALLTLAADLSVPVVLFADICSALRFKEWDPSGYYEPFCGQLQEAVNDGHDVQLHIHPHWMTSTYEAGTFQPSLDFSLSDFADHPAHSPESIIEAAYTEMTAVCLEADPAYRCLAYRAGGYNVGPAHARILQKLYDLGIRIDSSVVPGLYLDHSFSHVDYRSAPALPYWRIAPTGPLTEPVKTGDFFEVPITRTPISVAGILRRRWSKWSNRHALRERVYANTGAGLAVTEPQRDWRSKLRPLLNPLVLTVDLVHLEVSHLMQIAEQDLRRQAQHTSAPVLTLIGHPKSMGGYHRDLLRGFVEALRARYGEHVSFVTYPDLYASLSPA